MAKTDDAEHFEAYRPQTQAKHRIVRKYLRAFYHILKGRNDSLLYVDGFAGRGTYEESGEQYPGSPLLALEVIASHRDLVNSVHTVFIEADDKLFPQLDAAVEKFCKQHPSIKKPICCHGTFKKYVNEMLDYLDTRNGCPPTFLFVDPCGVEGTDFQTIQRLMCANSCELFMFFNYEGVNRIAGLGEGAAKTLTEERHQLKPQPS